jgi:hypothetical protein
MSMPFTLAALIAMSAPAWPASGFGISIVYAGRSAASSTNAFIGVPQLLYRVVVGDWAQPSAGMLEVRT